MGRVPSSAALLSDHTTVVQKQRKGLPPAEAKSEGLSQIILGGNAGELRLDSGMKGADLWFGVPLPDGVASVDRHAFDLVLDIIEPPEAIERTLGNIGLCRRPDIVEVISEMHPTVGLSQDRKLQFVIPKSPPFNPNKHFISQNLPLPHTTSFWI